MFSMIEHYDVQETRRTARAEGHTEGHTEGHAEGRTEGKMEEKLDIAKNLLEINRPVDEIVKVTRLTREEVERLRATQGDGSIVSS